MGKKREKVWNSVPLCIFWTEWKERNRIAFKDGSLALQKLRYSFVYNLWSWNRLYVGKEAFTLTGFFWSGWPLLRRGEVFLPFHFVRWLPV